MASTSSSDAAASFDPLRPTLVRIAYRMLGSVADAEDVVQDAFLRWLATDRAAVRVPGAFLRRVVTRLCLDQLKSARHSRETYIGPWLPEPIVADEEEVDDVTLPLMLALERLSPLERAAFLLHDVFGVSFDEIAETVDRDPAACRQLASRARTHVRAARPRFDMPRERGMEIAEAFFAASRSGDMTALGALLAADVTLHADGGGKVEGVRCGHGFGDHVEAEAGGRNGTANLAAPPGVAFNDEEGKAGELVHTADSRKLGGGVAGDAAAGREGASK